MKIPSKINICGIIYDVIFESVKCNHMTEEALWGNVIHRECVIYLNDTINTQKQWQTFFHEVTHAIAENYSIKINEDDVNRFANCFYQVLKDNQLLKE